MVNLKQILDNNLLLSNDLKNYVLGDCSLFKSEFIDLSDLNIDFSKELVHDLKNYHSTIQSYISLKQLGVESLENDSRILTICDVLEETTISLYDLIFSENPSQNYEKTDLLYSKVEDLSKLSGIKINFTEKENYFIKKNSGSHFYRIMHNLVKNKSRYGTNLEMLVEPVELENYFHYNIYDNSGVGISEKFNDPNEIFGLGVSGHDSTGIGLNVCKSLAINNLDGYLNVLRKNDDSYYDGAKFELGISKNHYLKKAIFIS